MNTATLAIYLTTLVLLTITALTGCGTLESTMGTRREAATSRNQFQPTIKISRVAPGAGAITINVGTGVQTDIEGTDQGGANVRPDTSVGAGGSTVSQEKQNNTEGPVETPKTPVAEEPTPEAPNVD